MEKAIMFNKCCFCVPLRVGLLIIGYTLMIVEAISLCFACYRVVAIGNYALETGRRHIDRRLIFFIVLEVGVFILYAIAMASSIVLVVGVHMRRKKLVKVFFIMQAVLMPFIGYIILRYLESSIESDSMYLLLLPHSITILIQFYSVFIAVKYHSKMNEPLIDSKQGVVYTAANSDQV